MKGAEMSINSMAFSSLNAPSFTANYPTATNWFTKRANAHFGIEATGVNG